MYRYEECVCVCVCMYVCTHARKIHKYISNTFVTPFNAVAMAA